MPETIKGNETIKENDPAAEPQTLDTVSAPSRANEDGDGLGAS